jgi:hypothetical protein
MSADQIVFQELDQAQLKEQINTQQLFQGYMEAARRAAGYRGSMAFAQRRNVELLLKDFYDPITGVKKQSSLGLRSPENEEILRRFVEGKAEAQERVNNLSKILTTQAAVNKARKLGRVPEVGAKIIRALDSTGLLGKGVKVVGTNAMFAYEAQTGFLFPDSATSTEDIDILLDARAKIRFTGQTPEMERTIMGLLKKVDKTFEKTPRTFQAANAKGYLVDLIRPQRDPPWKSEPTSISSDPNDLEAVQIAGLSWHENAPTFEAVALDVRGFPVRIVAPDPRAFAVHKHWLSKQPDRRTDKRMRDAYQAKLVGALVARHMPHLPFDPEVLKSFPKEVVDAAEHLFENPEPEAGFKM